LHLTGLIGTFMGRDALTLAASYLELTSADTVLLPAYNCKEVLRPFARTTQVSFYDVGPDLTINPDEIRASLKKTGAKALLIINYFGFLQPYRKELKEICAEQGVALIEDCAHSLLTAGSGDVGDLAVYSFRKLLPLPDGGGLRGSFSGRPVVPNFKPAIYANILSVASSAKSLLKFRSDTFSRAGMANGAEALGSAAPKKDARVLPLSWFAQRGLASADCNEVFRKKRSDFEFWSEFSAGHNLQPVFASLPAEVCPIGFPIRIKGREDIVTRAREKGVQLRVHWRLPAGNESACAQSYKLSADILTLPVYPELGPREREVITELVLAA
jgi:hypothetical protein